MGEAEKYSRIINPFIFHLQRLELEIKCPVCLNLLSQPTQLPCNHVFCGHCISNTEANLRCLLCEMSHAHQDLRPIPHLENIVSIFKNMSATFRMSDMQSSNRLMNSKTTDVTSQTDLMKNMNGEKYSRIINPLIFHSQKLELELKCPVCLNLLSQPTSLPCNHAFCSHCILNIENDLRCPLCQISHTRQDLRVMSHLQNIVSIFKSMSATLHVSDMQLSNRRMNSNTSDVTSQIDLMNNTDKEKSGGAQKSLFPDNEPVQSPVQPTEKVNTLEGHAKTSEQDGETRSLNLQAQPVLDNNVWDIGFDIFPFEQSVDETCTKKNVDETRTKKNIDETGPNIDTSESFTTSLEFDSRKELIDWAKKVGRTIGVVIVIGNSLLSNPRKSARVSLICERGGKPDRRKRKSDKIRRKSSTKKCGCPFELRALETKGKWRPKIICGRHNHALLNNSDGQKIPGKSAAGKLLDEEYDMIRSMLASGMRPREILSHLKTRDPTNASSIRTIYNARRKMRVMETNGRTDVQNES
ncbi:hypothetical protein QJS10_CPA09g01973 [Acorus calamus]|uniref:RING-type domain-containing protein n=1 Tax=Acorus calamus TaxID=4465 RepID=A0AAV9E9I6_ACOCL|nr:hypothetical protein QJS10_CPA09g01973 [Acorus calamus]